MAGRTPRRSRRDHRLFRVTLAAALAAGLAQAQAQAQTCTAPLHAPGALPAAATGKFALIESQCPALVEPAAVRRAAQLDLYSPVVPLGEPAPVQREPQKVVPITLPLPEGPLGRDGLRVIQLAPTLSAAARAHELDPLLLHAIAHVESRHNAQAVSPAGARGVMQVMPATGQRFGVTDAQRSLLDPQTNVNASAAYIRTLRQRYGDDLRLVLAAYNAGEGAVDKHGRNVPPYPETQAYVRDVLAIYRKLTTSFSVDDNGALVARTGSRS